MTFIFTDPRQFVVPDGYLFPFICMDHTPGGSNLGRIEWNVEVYKSKKNNRGFQNITQLIVWAKQTRDKRYVGKFFLLDCNTAGILTHSNKIRADFIHCAWLLSICDVHRNPIISAYPEDNHVALWIERYSDIGTRMCFLTQAEMKQKIN
jgi:hypothetical protein